MADYGLKYWWQKNRDGIVVRLEILKRGYAGMSKEINALTRLNIVLQGGQDSIDSPIVKSSLEVAVVDCSDIPDTDFIKYGNWTEFFTPDSTLYKFVVYQDENIRWSGYLTPDSYEEDLAYRSIISLTARDNIGHLSDFQFDYTSSDGMISLNTLFDKALEKINFPMFLLDLTPSLGFSPEDGSPGLLSVGNICFNISAFKNDTWYNALESALSSLGLVIRYMDYNCLMLSTLKQMTLEGEAYSGRKTIQFTDASGHRMLEPAYKEIRETLDYEFDDNVYAGELTEESFGSDEYYAFGYFNQSGRPAIPMPVNRINNGQEWSNYDQGGDIPASFDPFKYGTSEEREKWIDLEDGAVYFPVDIGAFVDPSFYTSYDPLLYTKRFNVGKFTFALNVDGAVSLYDDNTVIGMTDSTFVFTNVMFFAVWRGSKTLQYDGSSWVDLTGTTPKYVNKSQNESSFSIELPSPDDDSPGYLQFGIVDIGVLYGLTAVGEGNGLYARITKVSIASALSRQSSGFNVTTKYNESNNVMLERSPRFGQINFPIISPTEITNGLYYRGGGSAYRRINKWGWVDRDEAVSQQLPVLIHTQILTFHAKANNLLTGTLRDPDMGDPRFNSIWTFDGRDHLLVSGSLNLLTGLVENAVLREYQNYDELWAAGDVFTIESDVNQPARPGGSVYFIVRTSYTDFLVSSASADGWEKAVGASTESPDLDSFRPLYSGTGDEISVQMPTTQKGYCWAALVLTVPSGCPAGRYTFSVKGENPDGTESAINTVIVTVI